MEWLEKMRKTSIAIKGTTFSLVPASPIAAAELEAKQRALGLIFPADYRAFLLEVGPADVFGARVVPPSALHAHGEHATSDITKLTVFLPFAERAIPAGGKLVFAFRFAQDMVAKLGDIQAVQRGEERPVFHGADYDVAAGQSSHLTPGRAGPEMLTGAAQSMARTFAGWAQVLAESLRARAAQT